MPSHSNEILTLRDGRRLGYATFGDPQGKPLVFFHGFPGSRLEARLAHAAGAKLQVRLISLERPGFGLSDFKPRRTILDWPDDVIEAANILGLERFAVVGASGGGPYAAACAFKIAGRLSAAAIISGTGPHDAPAATEGMSRQNRIGLILARFPPAANAAMWWLGRQARTNPTRVIDRLGAVLPEPDRAIVARPDVRATLMADLVEAFRNGSRGATWELLLYSRPWGFRLQNIGMKVFLWQGEADANVPPSMGRYLASCIPNCVATFYPGEGHFMSVDRMEEIYAALFASGPAPERTSPP